MAISEIVKNHIDGELLIEDGTGTPLDVTVTYEAGDFSLTGLSAEQKEVSMYTDRGEFASLRPTVFSPATVSFTAHMTDISDASEETLPDMILQQGSKAAAISTLGANADVYTVKMTWQILEPGGTPHTVVCDDVRATIDMSEGDPNSFSISGTVYGSITMT